MEPRKLEWSPRWLRRSEDTQVLEITPSAVEVSTFRLPDIPNWLEDVMNPDWSIDAVHETLEAYHWGNPGERDFVIQRRR